MKNQDKDSLPLEIREKIFYNYTNGVQSDNKLKDLGAVSNEWLALTLGHIHKKYEAYPGDFVEVVEYHRQFGMFVSQLSCFVSTLGINATKDVVQKEFQALVQILDLGWSAVQQLEIPFHHYIDIKIFMSQVRKTLPTLHSLSIRLDKAKFPELLLESKRCSISLRNVGILEPYPVRGIAEDKDEDSVECELRDALNAVKNRLYSLEFYWPCTKMMANALVLYQQSLRCLRCPIMLNTFRDGKESGTFMYLENLNITSIPIKEADDMLLLDSACFPFLSELVIQRVDMYNDLSHIPVGFFEQAFSKPWTHLKHMVLPHITDTIASAVAKSCSQLQSLTILPLSDQVMLPKGSRGNKILTNVGLQAIAGSLTSLRSFVIKSWMQCTGYQITDRVVYDPMETSDIFEWKCKLLHTLVIPSWQPKLEAGMIIIGQLPDLKAIDIGINTDIGDIDIEMEIPTHTKLESLSLLSLIRYVCPQSIAYLVQHFPNLRALRLESMQSNEALPYLQGLFPNINIECRQYLDPMDDMLFSI
ncbi:hypothetical protein H4219_000509 [Mycoemilia scoparia]|uniref:Uncharacterized protein n=1 Tax=Mycoemilia scoparia TaxID=417184 RepID=A0A9W8DRK3_9FUNG|nr:hypothetical protein H4219_000509 [Mycoemilia scoparia]